MLQSHAAMAVIGDLYPFLYHVARFALFIQENLMTQFTQDARNTETSSQHAGIRLAELVDQNWSRNKSEQLAMREGISLTDQFREAADLLAIERGEDDGMIVHQSASLNIHNSKDFNAITTG